MFEVICITLALFLGLAARQVGLPPLVGFLAAGFAIEAGGEPLGLPSETDDILHHVAHLGVLLLLFTVGLKLKLRQIVQPQVVGGAVGHFAISVILWTPGLRLVAVDDWRTALLLAIALAFSSTVLAAKLLDARRELGSFHGRTSIGILVVQDILALAVLAIWSGQRPNAWVLLLIGLPLVRPILHRLLDLCGHDELLVLIGMLLALVVGGAGFEAVGLSPEIGALVVGVLLSTHGKAQELGEGLTSLKDLFLVGFFLEIGMAGLPGVEELLAGVVLGLLLPLKMLLFLGLLLAFGLRARTALLSAFALSAYSEFGLIVAKTLLPEQIVVLAIAVSVSFVLAAPANRHARRLVERLEGPLRRFERATAHPDEQPVSLGDADVIVFGMGRTGTAAYEHLAANGMTPAGLDSDTYTAAEHASKGRHVVFADAEDQGLWRDVDLSGIRATVLAMDDIEAKVIASRMLRRRGFVGPIVAHALHDDDVARLRDAGVDETYLTMGEAGRSLAAHVLAPVARPPVAPPPVSSGPRHRDASPVVSPSARPRWG